MEHNGPVFPKQFEHEPVEYKGAILSGLPLEMMWCCTKYYLSDYYKNKTFKNNFFKCFKYEAKKANIKVEKTLSDYEDLFMTLSSEQVIIKATTKRNTNKQEQEQERLALKEKYGYAIIDGERQPIGAFVVEPASIFIGRGDSPTIGLWKYQATEKDVTINCTSNPPKGNWKAVEANLSNFAVFSYDINLGNVTTLRKDIRPTYSSSVGQTQDKDKFERALNLAKNWKKVGKFIESTIDTTTDMKRLQIAMITWMIQNTCIRVGGEKDTNKSADTVGASTLRKKELGVASPNSIILSFLGKDSILYENTVEKVPSRMVSWLESRLSQIGDEDRIFDVSTTEINEFIKEVVPDCSAKMFRPALGTKILVEELLKQKADKSQTLAQKKNAFIQANIKTAELLNHKKAVAKGYKDQVSKLKSRQTDLKEKYQDTKKATADKISAYKTAIANLPERCTARKEQLLEKIRKEKEKLEKAKDRVSNQKSKIALKEQTKEIATGTSLGSYIDPQVVVSWAKSIELPIESLYSKTILSRFSWALDTEGDYWKSYK